MRILKQAESFAYRTAAALQFTPTGGLLLAHGEHYDYLIDPPGVVKERGRPGKTSDYLLHTKERRPIGAHGNPEGNPVWTLHSAHPSMEEAMAAAGRHQQGGVS